MIHLTMNTVANVLHVAIGVLFIAVPVAWGIHFAQAWGTGTCLVYAIIKEFLVDIYFEDEETSGGYIGGCKDFLGYLAGLLLGNLIVIL